MPSTGSGAELLEVVRRMKQEHKVVDEQKLRKSRYESLNDLEGGLPGLGLMLLLPASCLYLICYRAKVSKEAFDLLYWLRYEWKQLKKLIFRLLRRYSHFHWQKVERSRTRRLTNAD